MADMIRDGGGRGYLAKINKDNQLITRATAIAQHTVSAIDGNYYEIYTGQVTLTTAGEVGVIYMAPTEADRIFIVDKVFIETWASTGGSGLGTYKYYKNPTVTGGSTIVPVNSNFGTVDDFDGTALKSLTTMTGGTVWWLGGLSASTSLVIDEEKFCLPNGYGFGVSITAPAGNSSMVVNINIAGYYINPDLLE